MSFDNLFKHFLLKYIYATRMMRRVLVVTLATSLVWAAITFAAGSTQLVSVNRDGTDSSNYGAYQHALSADGRYVAFSSASVDLVNNDSNNTYDVYVRDLQTGTTSLISINREETNGGNGYSYQPSFSPNGRYVAFQSLASDLVFNDTNTYWDVFVRDLQNGTTTLVSVNSQGTNSGNLNSFDPVMSADGRFVAFVSYASDLVEHDSNMTGDVFVRDMQNGTTILVSANHDRTDSGNAYSNLPEISADGRYVAFVSTASNLVSNDTNNFTDVFVRDLRSGMMILASPNHAGTNSGNSASYSPMINADGRFVAYYSYASDLVNNDTNVTWDVFVRDLQAETTILASVNRTGTASGNGTSQSPVLSADGRFVAFQSYASDLVINDTNNVTDVFVRDLLNGTTTMASVNHAGTNGGNSGSDSQVLSADGRFVAFGSYASDLVELDTNNSFDVFMHDLLNGTTILASVNRGGIDSGNRNSYSPELNANGRFLAFESHASDLVSNDSNNTRDVFVREFNPNLPPEVDAGGPYNVNEGESVDLSASGIDPNAEPLTYDWDLDNDGSYETPGQSVTFSAAGLDGPSFTPVAVQVTDNEGLTAVAQTTVEILNVAPIASFANTSGTLIAGQSTWLVFSNPFDPSTADMAAGFLYSYDCTSDGLFESSAQAINSFACVYPDSGDFAATGRIQDKDGAFTDYSVRVIVLTPQQGAESIIDRVQELVDEGILNQGLGNALIAKLVAAIQQLDLGHVRPAINQLQAFISQVEAMIVSSILLPENGQPLIEAASEIIALFSN